jgi:hypothetical protein
MAEPDKKRHLPILQNKAPADEEDMEPRPPWHWSGFGVVITFLLWLPIAAAIAALTVRLSQNAVSPGVGLGMLVMSLHLLGFWLATFVGGFFIGKFGGEAGPREGAVSGFVTAAFAVALAASSPTQTISYLIWALLLVIIGGTGATSSFWGAKIGKKRRNH